MKKVIAFCAVLTFAAFGSATLAAARNPFDGYILRPPGSIPHGRGTRAAAAPVPRPKPVSAPANPAGATPHGAVVFPPVAPLE